MILVKVCVNSKTQFLMAHNLKSSTCHLLWKLKDFIAKAKTTAKIMQKATTIIPAIPKKSCLYPKPSMSNCFTGTE